MAYSKTTVEENKKILARAVGLLDGSNFDSVDECEQLRLDPSYTSRFSDLIYRQLKQEFSISSQRASTAVAKALRQVRSR